MRIVWIHKHTPAIYYIRDLNRQARYSTCSINKDLWTSSNTGYQFLLLNRQYSILSNMCTSEKYGAQLIRNQQHEYEWL